MKSIFNVSNLRVFVKMYHPIRCEKDRKIWFKSWIIIFLLQTLFVVEEEDSDDNLPSLQPCLADESNPDEFHLGQNDVMSQSYFLIQVINYRSLFSYEYNF